MSGPTVGLIAYGAGNTASVQFALERLGARVDRVSTPEAIRSAERLILPGVGAAAYAMSRLDALGLTEAILGFERPFLGICLGQQLLFDRSEEGDATLLGLIPGTVRAMVPAPDRPVPHMGWSRLGDIGEDPLLDGIGPGDHAYFVHSYVCPDGDATLARADYGGAVPAVVRRDNRWGCQFHPERSAAVGARILANFLEIAA